MLFGFRQIQKLEEDDGSTPAHRMGAGEAEGVGRLGMQIFLGSLTFVFGSTILLYGILMRTQDAPTVGVLEFVRPGLVVSTAILLVSSWTLRRATSAITRNDDRGGLAKWLRATLWLGYAFVASQSWVWFTVFDAGLELNASNRHAALFVLLTVLHALHVAGGIVRLHQVTAKARRGEYSKSNYESVTNAAMYWHYLDLVWLLMLAVILVLSS